jgi:hypothetical protein
MDGIGSSSGVYDWQKVAQSPSAQDYGDLDSDQLSEMGIDDDELYVNPYTKLFGSSPKALD